MYKQILPIILILMVLIFILSSLPIDDILDKAKHRLGALYFIRSKIQELFNIKISFATTQNILHIPFFALLAFLWMGYFSKRKIQFKKAVIYTFIIVFSFAASAELHQFFLKTRDASFFDLFLNVIGCLVGVGFYKFLVERGIVLRK